MEVRRITAGGQVSIPAPARNRWRVARVLFEDRGDHLIVRPVADDPVAAARGVLKGRLPPTETLRAEARRDEAAAKRTPRR